MKFGSCITITCVKYEPVPTQCVQANVHHALTHTSPTMLCITISHSQLPYNVHTYACKLLQQKTFLCSLVETFWEHRWSTRDGGQSETE